LAHFGDTERGEARLQQLQGWAGKPLKPSNVAGEDRVSIARRDHGADEGSCADAVNADQASAVEPHR
jgi:hypothetical protein